jgi:hypothetical protein
MTRSILSLVALLLTPLPAMHAADATQSNGPERVNDFETAAERI